MTSSEYRRIDRANGKEPFVSKTNKKRGRPKLPEGTARTKVLVVRVSSEDSKAIHEAAQRHKISVSKLVGNILANYCHIPNP